MSVLTSADGTEIAYEHTGSGPALVLVDGAMCHRAAGPMRPLAGLLRESFTVHTYDRRGRGDSSDTTPYAVAREIEDLQAVIARAGGRAYVYGISSGAALTLAAAAAGSGIARMALHEPPFMAESEDGTRIKRYTEQLHELLDAGRKGDAVALFMMHVGMPAQAVDGMRSQPGWAPLEAIAPTLAYDDEVLGDGHVPRALASTIVIPALVLAGGASPEGLQQAAKATADALPTAGHRTLHGQTHDVAPDVLAPVLAEFFGA
ncbi:alpha/beta fold hydrolase [Streptomyces sp. SID13666]|uniref:alpha/beta fold hydrolase n=1 Tax=unclassified Streptomyces TaxID=2593676 RepID=UPI0013C27C8A|nr:MULTISPECIES: alpha/beta hydrolase [unclassified Streptomyces]NEA52763.1 alpha/beta fold hydrolase [Streptomyces sp. SID13666]NEA69910.1 alpha/beta fold hydrolase [Streptomyces sp. SID13588]